MMILSFVNAWVWNPPRDLFIIPGLQHPIRVYGILFALSFLFGYFYMIRLFRYCLSIQDPLASPATLNLHAAQLADRLCWFVVIGTVVGARLGHVFFYQWSFYQQNPLEILQVWKGGLASHGGALAVILALALYARTVLPRFLPTVNFLRLLDLVAIPTAFVSFCIRLGNFFNQEIVGIPTTLPWGITFGDPLDGIPGIPLHPAQLYEAAGYLATFFLLAWTWKKWKCGMPEGSYVGLLFVCVFTTRILVETVKSPEVNGIQLFGLYTGQLLSLPFIAIGLILLLRAFYIERCRKEGTI